MPGPDHNLFLVDVFGEFPPDRLQISWRNEPQPYNAALKALVDETWDSCLQEAVRHDAHLYNGQLARCLRHRVDAGCLLIEVGPTDYASFLGTNFHNWQRADEFGWDHFANPLGISANVITADGQLILGRRNRKAACHAGYVHPIGGTIEQKERRPDDTFDAFASMYRELDEELHIQLAEIADAHCIGLIRDATIRQPELVFDIHTRLTRSEIESRLNPADPHQEHAELFALRDEPAAVASFIQAAAPITPIAVGSFHLHARRLAHRG